MEGRLVARQQYYSNYGGRGRRKRIKPRFYVLLTLVALLVMAGSFFINVMGQVKGLSMVTTEATYLEFEEIKTVNKWHNKEVKFAYLTFDDGPSRNTEKILDILDSYDIKGTFFVLGTSISNFSDSNAVLKRMADTGHYIGMHSMTHNYDYLYNAETAAANFAGEMKEEQALLKEITGGFESTLCRAPYGTGGTFTDEHVKALNEIGVKCWDWDVDTYDWASGSTVDSILTKVESDMKLWNHPSNAVILFHEKDLSVEALPKVIEYYLDLGYEFLPYNPNNHIVKNLFGSKDL